MFLVRAVPNMYGERLFYRDIDNTDGDATSCRSMNLGAIEVVDHGSMPLEPTDCVPRRTVELGPSCEFDGCNAYLSHVTRKLETVINSYEKHRGPMQLVVPGGPWSFPGGET